MALLALPTGRHGADGGFLASRDLATFRHHAVGAAKPYTLAVAPTRPPMRSARGNALEMKARQ